MAKLSILAGATSQSVNVFIQNSSSTTGAGLTGLVFNTSGLTGYYTFAGANATATAITLATLAAVNSAFSSGGFKELDSTNMPGVYRLDLPNAAIASAKGRSVLVYLQGAANMAPCVLECELTGWDNQDAVRGGMTALPNAAAEAAGGLYTRGAGAGQIAQQANGQIDANMSTIKTQAVTCAAGVTVLASVGTAATSTAQTGDNFARIGAPAGASISADIAAVKTDTAAVKVQTDKLAFSVANQIDANVLDWKGATAPAMTGDSFARLGAPAGASVSADVAAAKADTVGIKTKTDSLTFTNAGKVDANTLQVGGTVQTARDLGLALPAAAPGATGGLPTTNGTKVNQTADLTAGQKIAATLDTADVTGNLPAQVKGQDNIDFGALQKASLNAATPASVGSVTGNVGGSVASVTAPVTVGTNSDKTGYSLSVTPPTAATIATTVVDQTLSGHTTSGTVGGALNSASSAGDPWATALPGAYGAGTAGKIVGGNLDAAVSTRSTYAGADTAGTTTLLARLTSTRAALLDNLDAAVSGVAAAVWAVGTRTLTSFGTLVADVATAVWAAATRSMTDKAGFTLSALYDAAKTAGDATAASQTSILAKLPAALNGGRMDASVGAYQAGQVPAKVADLPAVPTTDDIVLAILQRKITLDAITGEFVIWDAAGTSEAARLTPTTDATALPIVGMRPSP